MVVVEVIPVAGAVVVVVKASRHYGLSLNSGQVVINNAAGSRAPLPGFSSFV
jgi:formylmethanofuran dehydrogenase subunit C